MSLKDRERNVTQGLGMAGRMAAKLRLLADGVYGLSCKRLSPESVYCSGDLWARSDGRRLCARDCPVAFVFCENAALIDESKNARPQKDRHKACLALWDLSRL